jgi:hypothetical protein
MIACGIEYADITGTISMEDAPKSTMSPSDFPLAKRLRGA